MIVKCSVAVSYHRAGTGCGVRVSRRTFLGSVFEHSKRREVCHKYSSLQEEVQDKHGLWSWRS